MKPTTMQNRITVRLDNDTNQSLEIIYQSTNVDKAKIVRSILKDWMERNSTKIDKLYEELQTN